RECRAEKTVARHERETERRLDDERRERDIGRDPPVAAQRKNERRERERVCNVADRQHGESGSSLRKTMSEDAKEWIAEADEDGGEWKRDEREPPRLAPNRDAEPRSVALRKRR